MPPPPPQVPNFTPGVGRLATDRYDFEAHITGTNFRHQANQIDLFPTVVVDGYTVSTVQEALGALATALLPAEVNQATATQLGIVTLAGDFNGINSTALVPRVSGLQGRPVQNMTPATGQVLTWSGSSWYPANSSSNFVAAGDLLGTSTNQTVIGIQTVPVLNTTPTTGQVLTFNGTHWYPGPYPGFTAAGDLSGNASSQTVIGIEGIPIVLSSLTSGQVLQYNGTNWVNVASGGVTWANDLAGSTSSYQTVVSLTGTGSHPDETVSVIADALTFVLAATPYISQAYGVTTGSTVATNMTIKAQGLTPGEESGAGDIGGTLVLAGGVAHGGDPTQGGVSLSVGGDPFTDDNGTVVFQVTDVPPPSGLQEVAAFFPSSSTGITSSDIPEAIGGNNFIYIGGTGDVPSGPALTGTLMWSDSNAEVFSIMPMDGYQLSIGNAITWGLQTSTSGQQITYIDSAQAAEGGPAVTLRSFTVPTNTFAYVECTFVGKSTDGYSDGYTVTGGFMNQSGALDIIGTLTSIDERSTGTLTQATISTSGTAIKIQSGYYGSAASNWTVVTKITLTPVG